MSWQIAAQETGELGTLRIYATPPGGARTEVTYFRGAPSQILSYGSTDPYGDGTAQLSFPQIGIFDDLGQGDLAWLAEFTDIDILLDGPARIQTVFEGHVVSLDWAHSDAASALNVTLRGALYQVDGYVSHPSYPPAPVPYEQLIAAAFDPQAKPHLRTQPLKIEWPQDWTLAAYSTTGIPGTQAGAPTTGFATRTTGAWDKLLTGFVSNLLQTMYTSDYADQWTIRQDPGRQPVLYVRNSARTPDYVIDAGSPGVAISLSRDYSQYANVIYGSGTGLDKSTWSRQSVSPDGTFTDYIPMAADERVYPDSSPSFSRAVMRAETHVAFEDGIEESTALRTSQLLLRKNEDPGYAGTITLSIDVEGGSRYLIRAGQTLQLRYFAGTGEDGLRLHVSEVSIDVTGGTATLTVDSKYRDALTVAEVLARTRDPLTPIKFMQVGKQSVLIPDELAPWSYALGSGYLPKASKAFFDRAQTTDYFPYDALAAQLPPKVAPSYYVCVPANAKTRDGRWAGSNGSIPIRMSERGSIRLTQIALYNRDGVRVPCPFHVSLYSELGIPTVDNMPFDGNGHSPFIPGAFQDNNKYGLAIPANSPGNNTMKQGSLQVGWGDGVQPAGYSPGTFTNGDAATGLLIDETGWQFDNTTMADFQQNPSAGYIQPEAGISLYAMIYAEWHEPVYAIGRFYREEPGSK
jgi:hypothetical protein